MDFYNRLQKYINKLNLVKGGADRVGDYIFKQDGFQQLINHMIILRNRLPDVPVIVGFEQYEYISWGDIADNEDNVKKMFDLIDAYFSGFKEIWKELIEYILVDSQVFFTIDYRIHENDENSKSEFAFGVLTAIYNEISGDLIDKRELCIHRYTPHSNDKCVNELGVKNTTLLHWPSLLCRNDDSPPSKQNQGKGGCGQHNFKVTPPVTKCAFLHKDQKKYEIPYNNLTFIARVGFNTLPGKGYWYNGLPFVNNTYAIPKRDDFVPKVPVPPV